jgi:BASS family bile acid:Na+ symporter
VSPVKIVTLILLISMMLNVGLQSNREHLLAVLKNYGLMGRALLANFILVPIFGVLIVRLFQLHEDIATGFLLMAIAPGVPFVVAAGGRKKGGSLGFAVALAFIMPTLSVLTVPITAQWVLPSGAAAHVPAPHILPTLALFQLVPLIVGMLIAANAPTLAEKLERPLGVVFLLSVVALLVLLGPNIARAVASVYGSRGILADLTLVVLSLATGWILGGPESPFRHTLSIATALRNIGLCAVVAASDFPNSLVAPAVMTYLIVQAIVCTLVGAYFTRTSKPAAPAPA